MVNIFGKRKYGPHHDDYNIMMRTALKIHIHHFIEN